MTTRKTTLVLALAAFAVSYARVARDLTEAWFTSGVYSYGVAVLLIAIFMIWTKWARLRTLPAAPDYLFGVPLTLAGLAMLVVGRVGLLTSMQEASLIVTLAGLVLLLFGRAVFACVWFPLGYLMLGFPVWDTLVGALQPPSQQISGRLAAGLLRTIGIPVLQDGTRLALPTVTLEVLRECSGVNQLLAVVAMALPAGYIWLRTASRRVALVVLAVIGAYASNGIRIALVGYLATHGLGDGDLRGVHLFEGLAISALCYLLILACLSVLSRTERETGAQVTAADARPSPAMPVRRLWLEAAVSIVVLAIGAGLYMFRTPDVRLKGDLQSFPAHIGEWTLETRPAGGRFPALDDDLVHAYPSPEGERHFVALDDELVRSYRNESGERVRLYIGYHRSQREGKELAGEASHALSVASTPLRLRIGSETVELGQVVQDRPAANGSRGVLYWYDLNGRMFSSMYLAKRYMVWDALTRRRTNGAVVMIAWESGAADADTSRRTAAAFAQSILPLLPEFIPS